ncbi:MAG: hypothetical protein ACI90R_002440, partial [Alteromonas macleodii]
DFGSILIWLTLSRRCSVLTLNALIAPNFKD